MYIKTHPAWLSGKSFLTATCTLMAGLATANLKTSHDQAPVQQRSSQRQQNQQQDPSQQHSATGQIPKMEYVEICKSLDDCKRFSRLVMGTDHLIQADWQYEGQPEAKKEEVYALLDEAVRMGINFFDTSPIYVGGVEYTLGQWAESRKERIQSDDFYYHPDANPDRKIYILSKGGFPFDLFWAQSLPTGTHAPEFVDQLKAKGIMAEGELPASGQASLVDAPAGTYASRLHGSLEQIQARLGEEIGHTVNNLHGNITVYLMHRDDGDFLGFEDILREKTPVERIMQALNSEDLASKYWMYGWSNWQTDRIDASIELAKQNLELQTPAINSPYFSLFEMSERSIHAGGIQVTHEEMMQPHFQSGITLMPYSPLGGFSILDKAEPIWENAQADAKAKYDAGDAYWQNVYKAIFTAQNKKRYQRARRFLNDYNDLHFTDYTLDQLLNAYALAHTRMDMLAIGPINLAQLKRTVGSTLLAKQLTAADLEYLYSGLTQPTSIPAE